VPHAEGTPAGGSTNAQGLGFNLDTSLILAHGVDVTGSTTGRVSPGSSGSPTPTGGNVGAPTSQTPGAPQADGGSSQASPTYNVPPPQTSTDTGGFLGLSTTTLLLIAGAIVLFMVVRK
jgi:hypothetical protein